MGLCQVCSSQPFYCWIASDLVSQFSYQQKGIYTNKLFLVFSRLFHGNNRVAHVRWYCSRRDHGQYPKCRCLSSSDIRLYYHFYFNYPAEQGAIEVSEFPKSGDFDWTELITQRVARGRWWLHSKFFVVLGWGHRHHTEREPWHSWEDWYGFSP